MLAELREIHEQRTAAEQRATQLLDDEARQAAELHRVGLSVAQIAHDLRITRREAQTLIERGRRT